MGLSLKQETENRQEAMVIDMELWNYGSGKLKIRPFKSFKSFNGSLNGYPEDWNIAKVVNLLKKRNRSLRSNFRGAFILTAAYKLYE
jgi:hypothetical protein